MLIQFTVRSLRSVAQFNPLMFPNILHTIVSTWLYMLYHISLANHAPGSTLVPCRFSRFVSWLNISCSHWIGSYKEQQHHSSHVHRPCEVGPLWLLSSQAGSQALHELALVLFYVWKPARRLASSSWVGSNRAELHRTQAFFPTLRRVRKLGRFAMR